MDFPHRGSAQEEARDVDAPGGLGEDRTFRNQVLCCPQRIKRVD